MRLNIFLGMLAGVFLGVIVGLAFLLSRKFPDLKERPFKTAKEWMEHSWLAGLPSTNFKILTTVVLYFLTFGVWALATLLEKTIEELSFGMWLGFLAGLGGFALAQFNKQRATDYGAMERQAEIERAKAGAAAPSTNVTATGPTNITGSPVVVDGAAAEGAAPTPPPATGNGS